MTQTTGDVRQKGSRLPPLDARCVSRSICCHVGAVERLLPTMTVVGLLLLGCALSFSLPAPENLTVQSVNFNHTLSWNAGASTPVGTRYLVYDTNGCLRKRLTNSRRTWAQLKLSDQRCTYLLTVVATHNKSRSPESRKLPFAPYKETKIGPPVVWLTGCDRCLHSDIILPAADRVNIHDFYNPLYRIAIRKRGEQQHGQQVETHKLNYTLQNLHSGTEYCVQVHVQTINPNIQPSAWTCAFTSGAEPSTGPLEAGLVVAVVLLVGLLIVSVSCLYYLGFITRLKMMLPPVLLMNLSPGYTLTPERTVPDLISISPKLGRHKQNSPQPADQEEEEEEEEEEGGRRNIYVEKNAELYPGQSPCSDADDGLCDGGLPAAEPDCDEEEEDEAEEEGETDVRKDEAEEEGETDVRKDEAEEEGETDVRKEAAQEKEAWVAEEWEEEQELNSLGDINLLSVRLKALEQPEEEEQSVEWTEQEALLPPDQAPERVRTPVEAQSVPDEEEEGEEEEEEGDFSAYLSHS